MNTPFSQLSKELQLIFLTIPVYLPSTQNPDAETKQQVVERQDRFLRLPKGVRWKLASFDIGNKIEAIGQKYGFELLHLANITRLIRKYYFGEIRLENFPAEIEKRMGVSLLTAQEITRYLKQEIIDWDPWAKYIAGLSKFPIREIVQQYPKIGDTEITAEYIELKDSEDLEDPTIKNWLKDFVSHLGYEPHSQMQRAQYLFHSENGKNLSSQDREKLGIILKSFDEKVPLPVDEENGEIVFDGVINDQRSTINNPITTAIPKSQPTLNKQEPFIKPYVPISQQTLPPRQTSSPRPLPLRQASSPLHTGGQAYKGEGDRHISQPQPIRNVPANFASQIGKEEINKYFSAPESLAIPEIKIHSITEHNEPRIALQQTRPQQNVQHFVSQRPQPTPRPKHKTIYPFFSKSMPEPRIDGNIVDLSREE
jgi:hypothetical protein